MTFIKNFEKIQCGTRLMINSDAIRIRFRILINGFLTFSLNRSTTLVVEEMDPVVRVIGLRCRRLLQ